ncbi:parallel beta-helix repeat protein [Sinobacterium caligoides]|uniref:Parallel beta-helix repeat protein n=1 Tax=Sinobacterium caligoides TaxID=933926 RepID=A0A3N2DZX0_9GAMM|nr:parallel beta-helix domain-containing protein [Sinobacterium caligoides]ROS04865.1 parallel beta-helix repeat protein [Sinobacterium caligoides]
MNRLLKTVLVLVLVAAGVMVGKQLGGGGAPVVITQSAQVAAIEGDDYGADEAAAQIANVYTGETIFVNDGESIQDAVELAKPGDTIAVMPGTYKQIVYIDKNNIRLTGVIKDGKWPVLDGERQRNDAILYSGNSITVENFKIIHYKGNAIMGQAGNNFIIRNNWIVDTGVYGIFPQYGKNGLIERNVLSGIEDAAIYVGMCDNIDVRNNEVFNNVAGIEIENTRHALVENNHAHDNTGGILVFITPGLPIKTTYDVIVRNNFIVNNNHENFGAPGSIVAGIPPGTGILVMAADDVVIENNIISGNDNAGITITDLSMAANVANDPDSEPNPDGIKLLNNFMIDNGHNPVGELKILLAAKLESKGPDFADTGKGVNKCAANMGAIHSLNLGADYAQCEPYDTNHIRTMLLAEPVAPRTVPVEQLGERGYYGICAGCHAYSVRMIGPPTQIIQAMYMDNPQGISDYINAPIKKRKDFPEMPPQNYLDEKTRLAIAEYMLTVKK